MRQPHVLAAIHVEQARQIVGELAGQALGVLRRILGDEEAPLKVRLDAAKTVLDRAGHAPITGRDTEKDSRPKRIDEMNLSELDEWIATLEAKRLLLDSPETLEGEAQAIEIALIPPPQEGS